MRHRLLSRPQAGRQGDRMRRREFILNLSGAATVEAAPARADLKAAAPGPRLDQRRSGEPDLECVPRMRRSVERSGKVLSRRAA
jgi:hypothetical protein